MITVTGSLAFDHIMDYPGRFSDHIMPDKIHQINLSFLVTTLKKQKGGTAGNIAYNLALLKNPVSILGIAGSDFSAPTESGCSYKEFLQQAGVDTSLIKTSQSITSTCYIMTDIADNQITAFYPGAMNEAETLSLGSTKTDLVVISPNNPKAMVKFVKECQSSGTGYMLDPGMQLPALDPENLKMMVANATILIGNDYEISLLKEKTGLDETQLLNQVKVLITTLGENGSIIQTNGLPDSPSRSQSPPGRWSIKAGKPNQVVDPTGAGDAYRAGFLAGYLKGLGLQICGQMGAVAACYTVEKYGTTSHAFSLEEFKRRYKENFGEDLIYDI
ncbi:MAG: carbohydrate kinase family protein [Candidatus Daviesbacteria bacterium]|nr:carbohydrate kinase family protein [Candidatus Daviesbacteria bacterium]